MSLSVFLREISVPIQLERASRSSVIWFDEEVFTSADEVLSKYAYALASPLDRAKGPGLDPSDSILGYADHYGSTSGLSPHGGAGRAAAVEDLYVKGVGPTTLVGSSRNALHSHGCLWLEEAMREVIFARLCKKVLGNRALPVLAVIDCGIPAMDQGVAKSRALLVREPVLRVSHLQRALGFRPYPSFHLDDVKRVKRAREFAMKIRSVGSMYELACALANELGITIALAHRGSFFQGGLTSGNVDVNGVLLDYGGARFVSNQGPICYEDRGQHFGSELAAASMMLASIIHEQHEYLPAKQHEEKMRHLQERLLASYAKNLGEAKSPLQKYQLADDPGRARLLEELSRESIQTGITRLLAEEAYSLRDGFAALLSELESTLEQIGNGLGLE